MSLRGYWDHPCFQVKKPNIRTGEIREVGDNIYEWNVEHGEYRQWPSQHSNKGGAENATKRSEDTAGDRDMVLISDDFIYWGKCSPQKLASLKTSRNAGVGTGVYQT